jgi:hypothetical protein
VKKKSGCGCFGCGCALLVVIAVMLLGGLGAAAYVAFQSISGASSPAAAEIPAFTATAGNYQQVSQKLTTVQQAARSHQPSSVQLSSDDINTLLAENPNFAKYNVHGYVSMDGSTARLLLSVPSDSMMPGVLKGRYFNFDTSFTVNFDPDTKNVVLVPQTLQIGDKQLVGSNADNSALTKALVAEYIPFFNQTFNQGLRKNPDTAQFLDQAQTITVQNGALVIETK